MGKTVAKVPRQTAAALRSTARLTAQTGATAISTGTSVLREKAREEFAAALRRDLPNMRQCKQCGYGPVDHGWCSDLRTHHGNHIGRGGQIDNSCAKCHWFSPRISDWPAWDGKLPVDFEVDHNSIKPATAISRCRDTIGRVAVNVAGLTARIMRDISEALYATLIKIGSWCKQHIWPRMSPAKWVQMCVWAHAVFATLHMAVDVVMPHGLATIVFGVVFGMACFCIYSVKNLPGTWSSWITASLFGVTLYECGRLCGVLHDTSFISVAHLAASASLCLVDYALQRSSWRVY